jgi:hypothetical protein
VDGPQHGLSFPRYLRIPEPDDTKALRFEKGGPALILRTLRRMMPSVYLDYELSLQTHEVSNERANHVLPPKLESSQASVPQIPPQHSFGVGLTPS